MNTAVVIEHGAPLPDSWIDRPDVLVLSQLERESYSQFVRRLRQRIGHYAERHILKEVRYYAASKADSRRVRRFRLVALRSILRPLRRSAELHLFIPAGGASQFSPFRLVDMVRDFADRACVNIRLTFMPGAWNLAPAMA